MTFYFIEFILICICHPGINFIDYLSSFFCVCPWGDCHKTSLKTWFPFHMGITVASLASHHADLACIPSLVEYHIGAMPVVYHTGAVNCSWIGLTANHLCRLTGEEWVKARCPGFKSLYLHSWPLERVTIRLRCPNIRPLINHTTLCNIQQWLKVP